MAIKRTTWAGRRARRSKSKKDTKKWCKGVVGREHVLTWKPLYPGSFFYRTWEQQLCRVCGKRLRLRVEKRKP